MTPENRSARIDRQQHRTKMPEAQHGADLQNAARGDAVSDDDVEQKMIRSRAAI